ncbi:SRPBCC family protein [Natronosporangium hydrolyticum]|uniref:SRPBCC family protein n=1 Tax=Natronosporangium hydrolyticum TaxID=2811111 RepID=A0A895YN88_9ACTN|nr:SRPBCC family protein [Natronosporangium hydrolyticum]QSB16773.1 SRPBCC family protein [Natronosporangium hydrolyticum]
MRRYDLVDEARIPAPPNVVWESLIAELRGAGRWWVPHNTFRAGPVGPEQIGGETEVTVHPKGVDKGGPKLRFTARTKAVEPGRRLSADYISGAFRGRCEFLLHPIDGTGHTLIGMRFEADPQGMLKLLSKLTDIGAQHSAATQHAFASLAAQLADDTADSRPKQEILQ